jgi:ferredoxin-NADP reductase
MGELVLPDPLPEKLLFISGGIGITPIVSMIRELVLTGFTGNVTCLHYAREEVVFGDELARLLEGRDTFRFVHRPTKGTCSLPGERHFSRVALETLAPDWREHATFLCGPPSLEDAVTGLWGAEGLSRRLRVERFRPMVRTAAASDETRHRIVFAKSGVEIEGHRGAFLLDQAEDAGLRPAYGCRMGICHTCACTKRHGVVRSALTGQIHDADDEEIRPCISTPLSSLVLDL